MDVRKLSLLELGRDTPEDYRARPKLKLFFVADHIRSGHNVGALFRIADAFCFEGVHLCGYAFDPSNPEVQKTAIGAQQTVRWTYWADTGECLASLRKAGVVLVGVEQTDRSIMLQDVSTQTDRAYALVLGNEVKGLSDDILSMMDLFVEIPQSGTKHSINVSVAAGIVAWEFFRRMGLK